MKVLPWIMSLCCVNQVAQRKAEHSYTFRAALGTEEGRNKDRKWGSVNWSVKKEGCTKRKDRKQSDEGTFEHISMTTAIENKSSR